jgi:hypothetical protein
MIVWTATCERSGGDEIEVIIKVKFARRGRRRGGL